ncbi:MAG: haloacid dehalogenase-like hydrolase [Clostridiales bacterium]|nr:haloacid dehalogenase-like hydrolase [Clostridiales bacterium]
MQKKEQNPILAICYDFDKTLSPDDMQAQGYIQSINYEVADFWKESNQLATDNDMDQNLAYMFMMINKARGKVLFTKDTLKNDGSKVQLFPGVESWFDRINRYGEKNGVQVEHYIISSGLKEMIEGTSVADKFKRIYASSFYYDECDVAVWPAQVVNYTNKTQFLFRIEKGVLDVNDQKVNAYFEPDEYRVPFRNMVYIGDSDTDIPCMKLVNMHGGHSIGVYNSDTKDKSKVYKMIEENRIKYFVSADYTEGSELETLLKQIIDRTKTNEVLENIHYKCKEEREVETQDQSKEDQEKQDLINALEDSESFKNTHAVVAALSEFASWTDKQKKKLINIALENTQVEYILKDEDVCDFYTKICDGMDSEESEEVRNIMEKK